jgi:hypothetical protein
MEFPEIVSMIDADLELLKKVRQLLAPFLPPPSSGIQKTVKPNRKRATPIQLGLGGFDSAEVQAASTPESMEVTEQKPLLKESATLENSTSPRLPVLRGRSQRRHNERSSETSALKGAVPSGPVFVTAQAVSAKSRATVVAQRSVAVMPPALTAETLARQWLTRENA